MNNRHLFLSPELLSRISFTQPNTGVYYVQALASHKPRRALPEEIIRQLMILSLIHQYYYPEQMIKVEHPIQMGRAKKRADIVVTGKNGGVDIVIEVKQKVDQESIEQLKSYLMATGATYGMAISGTQFTCIKMISRNSFNEVADIPFYAANEGIFINKTNEHHSNDTDKIPSEISSIAVLQESLQIENFEKIDQSHVNMVIQGCSFTFSIADLIDYRKLQKRCLVAGIILAKVEQAVWLSFIQELLVATPNPSAPRSIGLRATLKLERFEKIDKSHVTIVIQGCSLNLPIADLITYRKTQKRFMAEGVLLPTQIEQTLWFSFIQGLLAETPNPVTPQPKADEWATRIASWIQSIPADRNFLTAQNIIDEAIGESNKNLDYRRIAKVMRSLGWQPKQKRTDGFILRGYMRND